MYTCIQTRKKMIYEYVYIYINIYIHKYVYSRYTPCSDCAEYRACRWTCHRILYNCVFVAGAGRFQTYTHTHTHTHTQTQTQTHTNHSISKKIFCQTFLYQTSKLSKYCTHIYMYTLAANLLDRRTLISQQNIASRGHLWEKQPRLQATNPYVHDNCS